MQIIQKRDNQDDQSTPAATTETVAQSTVEGVIRLHFSNHSEKT